MLIISKNIIFKVQYISVELKAILFIIYHSVKVIIHFLIQFSL